MSRWGLWLLLASMSVWLCAGVAPVSAVESGAGIASPKSPWADMLAQADAVGLPTKFLRVIPQDFLTLEFEDLHTFAAEYHPQEHRMLLSLALSFNGAGGTLKPLAKMTHREVGTLFHEFFHAYMDYIGSQSSAADLGPEIAGLRAYAEEQQRCRYQVVTITPVVQRKGATEVRFLSEREAWEALNESWAVFVGWAIWSQLETGGVAKGKSAYATERWLARLKKADRNGDLIGYYEPEDPAERRVTQKRYLAPSHRLTPGEVQVLLEVLFGVSSREAQRASSVMEQRRSLPKEAVSCRP
ncbi:MAG: hypothetical protein KGJ14_08940 [Nitrospirota bacterium]|nr:hypothetical protein [Nitrospirota bacterium]